MWRRAKRDSDLDEELRYHVERQTEVNVRAGMSPEEARRQALLQFGNVPLVKEDTRAAWTRVGLEQFLQDLRFGARILTKSPGLSATAAILIALVVGINTTIFSMVNGMVRRPAPGVTADDLVKIALADRPGAGFFSFPDYLEYRKQTKTLRALTAITNRRVTVTIDRGSYQTFLTAVDANYFETVGVPIALGRAFGSSDVQAAASGVTTIISDDAWRNYFDRDPGVIGRAIEVNGIPATIVGVAPPAFHGTMLAERAELWMPLLAFWQMLAPQAARQFVGDRNTPSVDLMGRLAPGRTVSEAQAEFSTIEARLRLSDPSTERHQVSVVRYAATAGGVVPAIMPAFLALFSIVTLLTVLIVSANVANLMLARSMARQRETALRQSLGASRVRIVRLLLAEGLSISLAAWLAACLMTMWAVRVIPQLLPPSPVSQGGLSLAPDWRVLSYAMLLAGVGTVAFTLAPALRVWKQDPLPWLKAGEQSVAQGRSRLSSTLVVLQLAFSVLLLSAAGLASRSASMMTVDLGFESRNLLVARISTAGAARTSDGHREVIEQVRERFMRIPGVQSVSYFGFIPSVGAARTLGSVPPARATVYAVGPDYLEVLGLRVVSGRALERDNHARGTAVAVVNQNLAEALWPGQVAVGQTMLFGPDRQSIEVVGVVANAFVTGFNPERPEPKPNYAFVAEQRNFSAVLSGDTLAQGNTVRAAGPGEITLYMRHGGDVGTVASAVGPALREVDRRLAITFVRTMDEHLELLSLSAGMIARLLLIFSIVSLVIAAIGQYAVVAFNMRRRVREFGVRIALGASAGQVIGGVLREGLFLTCIGLTCGLALSVGVAVAARSVLFNVTPTDPQTYAGVFTLLAVVSLAACCLPARGASRVDPVRALRQE